MSVPVVRLSAVEVLALACLGILLGAWLKRKISLLDRLAIPTPVAGGLVFAVAVLALRDRAVNFEPDLALRDILMVAFFTTIGMGVSARVIRQGGTQMAVYLGLATLGAVIQNALGIGIARLFGVDPLLGVVSGSVALAGGPATALAFGGTFEKAGVTGATTAGVASATFGITVAGLLGGYIGVWLIRRHRLQAAGQTPETHVENGALGGGGSLLNHVIAIGVAMGLGALISRFFGSLGVILPSYIGAMLAAAGVRAVSDRWRVFAIDSRQMERLGKIALYLFIVIALTGLRLWELAHLALPLVAMLVAQVALVWLLSVVVSFRLMGRDYESAVMAAGYCGFMLGTTANALASMDEVTRNHGPAPRAMLVVPVVGAFLIDFTNALVITAALNLIR